MIGLQYVVYIIFFIIKNSFFFTKKFFFSEKGFYLCTAKPQGTHSGCSAVGSVQRSGRWGRQFESGHSDQVQKTALFKGGFFYFSPKIITILIRCGD